MPQILLTAPSTIRHFILYEAKRKTPIFEGFKNLAEVVGDENINFPEYEFWYYRFLSGNYDLEDDRSSISQPLTLLDLPMDSLLEVISHLDVKNRFIARKVVSNPFGMSSIFGSKIEFESFRKAMENIELDAGRLDIKVKHNEEALKILSLFNPGKLEYLCLESFDNRGNINDLVEMDQFKKARVVHMEEYGFLDSSLLDRYFNFDDFSVRMEDVRREDVTLVQNALEKLPNDRHWTIHSANLVRAEVEQAIDQTRVIAHYDYDLIYYRTKIPNSDYFISFDFLEGHSLTMDKHK